MASSTVQFPSKAVIVSYLEQHNLTSQMAARQSERGIIEIAASVFDGKKIALEGIDTEVRVIMRQVARDSHLNPIMTRILGLELSLVLKAGIDEKWKISCLEGKNVVVR